MSLKQQIKAKLSDPHSSIVTECIVSAEQQIIAKLHRESIYHLEPISVQIAFENDEDKGEMSIRLNLHSLPHNMTWATEYEVIEHGPADARAQWEANIKDAASYLTTVLGDNIKSAMPDKPWTLGIDQPTSAWMLANLNEEQIKRTLRNASPTGVRTYPDRDANKIETGLNQTKGGASITLSGMIVTARLNLGDEVRYQYGVIVVNGLLPITIRDGLVGQPATAVINHPLLKNAGTISTIYDNADSDDNSIFGQDKTYIALNRKIIGVDNFVGKIGNHLNVGNGSDRFTD